jgi:hypothetical protein
MPAAAPALEAANLRDEGFNASSAPALGLVGALLGSRELT